MKRILLHDNIVLYFRQGHRNVLTQILSKNWLYPAHHPPPSISAWFRQYSPPVLWNTGMKLVKTNSFVPVRHI